MHATYPWLCVCMTQSVRPAADRGLVCENCLKPVTASVTIRKAVINRTPSRPFDKRPRSVNAPTYQYDPINQNEIRLVLLLPGTYDDEVHCTLIRISINSSIPRYDAVSYTWADESGDATKSRHIYCGEERGVIPVTANCEAMLRRLRLPNLRRLVWVDAICINQEFVEELNHQVGLMSTIYMCASRVLVYLGEGSEETNLVFDYIRSIHEVIQYLSIDDLRDHMSERLPVSLTWLASRRWFSRVWVVQEVALANEGEWICGNRNVRLDYLVPQTLRNFNLDVPPNIDGLLTFAGNPHSTSEKNSLWDLLQYSRQCDATDPRDRIYALRGLTSGLFADELVPDYTKSVEDVYIEAAVHVVRKVHSPNILFLRYGRSTEYHVPSWVPDFRSGFGTQLELIHDSSLSGHSRLATVFFPAGRLGFPQLDVFAVSLGTILEAHGVRSEETKISRSSLFEQFHSMLTAMDFISIIVKGLLKKQQGRGILASVADESWTGLLRRKFGFVCPSTVTVPMPFICSGKRYGGKLLRRVILSETSGRSCAECRFAKDISFNCGEYGSRFYTKRDLAVGPSDCMAGDVVFSICGARYLVVLRPIADGYKYIGPCFMLNTEPIKDFSISGFWREGMWHEGYTGKWTCGHETENVNIERVSIH